MQPSPVLLDAMTAELDRAMADLGKPSDPLHAAKTPQSPYFLSYSASDVQSVGITAQFGALVSSQGNHSRSVDVLVRVGDEKLDNTHGNHRSSALNTVALPLNDDRRAIQRSLWWATNEGYGNALHNYLQVKTETQVRAKEEDSSPDFSREPAQVAIHPPAPAPAVNASQWEQRMRSLSAVFRSYPEIYSNLVSLQVNNETRYFVSSEGARVVTPHRLARIIVYAGTRAEDGMDLFRARTFEAETADGLPAQPALEAAVRQLAISLEQLRKAPVTEPFDGPAILSGRAAAVFFHEVLGHRLEGQRQRGNDEGQTFTRDVGKAILPDFLSVADDPTRQIFDGTYLSGYYQFDDEGQPSKRVDLISDGVLETFLMSRLPIADFASSNGHGRAQPGRMPTGRQGNLIVSSTRSVPDAQLRSMLLAEAKKQGKPYGLLFEDISSGFAVTTRNMPQAFQVLPLVVYRVYVDGRPDELVRGVSIVGTPQAALSRIAATGTRREVFNGECGAESGSVAVSAVAPAMLVREIETQRQPQGTSRQPILPMPAATDVPGGTH
ncbi:MAG TPA: metallopeptidase TldD-related protein [Acidisarcina sp.]|nr:metallopeptidase TldD-related protein [Acidisarcina sp.]